jgi:acetylornithine/N-succinyldiaminopimelate aminotransferase
MILNSLRAAGVYVSDLHKDADNLRSNWGQLNRNPTSNVHELRAADVSPSREELIQEAISSGHEPIDLSLGIYPDAQSDLLTEPLNSWPRGYPPSAGIPQLRAAARDYLARTYGAVINAESVAVCAGAKEFIASLPIWLRQLDRSKDTVFFPELSYPAYADGARAADSRMVAVPVDTRFRLRLDRLSKSDVSRGLCLWVNSPSNPTGTNESLPEIAAWGRAHNILICSDESYAELNWADRPRTILEADLDGVLAVHSLSKRSNAPGLRVGFYAGDTSLMDDLINLRRRAGLMASMPAQLLAARLLDDDDYARSLRARVARRLFWLTEWLMSNGFRCNYPEGGMFIWLRAPTDDGGSFARWLARVTGLIVAPGSGFGPTGSAYVRIAAVHQEHMMAPRLLMLSKALTKY